MSPAHRLRTAPSAPLPRPTAFDNWSRPLHKIWSFCDDELPSPWAEDDEPENTIPPIVIHPLNSRRRQRSSFDVIGTILEDEDEDEDCVHELFVDDNMECRKGYPKPPYTYRAQQAVAYERYLTPTSRSKLRLASTAGLTRPPHLQTSPRRSSPLRNHITGGRTLTRPDITHPTSHDDSLSDPESLSGLQRLHKEAAEIFPRPMCPVSRSLADEFEDLQDVSLDEIGLMSRFPVTMDELEHWV